MSPEELKICVEYREAGLAFNEAHRTGSWTGGYKDRSDAGNALRGKTWARLAKAVADFDELIEFRKLRNDPSRRPGR